MSSDALHYTSLRRQSALVLIGVCATIHPQALAIKSVVTLRTNPELDDFRAGRGDLGRVGNRMAYNPQDLPAGIGYERHARPLPPRNFAIYKDVMHFLAPAQTQRRHPVSGAPGSHSDGGADRVRVQVHRIGPTGHNLWQQRPIKHLGGDDDTEVARINPPRNRQFVCPHNIWSGHGHFHRLVASPHPTASHPHFLADPAGGDVESSYCSNVAREKFCSLTLSDRSSHSPPNHLWRETLEGFEGKCNRGSGPLRRVAHTSGRRPEQPVCILRHGADLP